MTEEQFKRAEDLKFRIRQLEFLANYLEAILKASVFNVTIQVDVLDRNMQIPFGNTNAFNTNMYGAADVSDKDYIIGAVNNRIDILKKEFEEIK